MQSAKHGFKLLDRGFNRTLVLIPGWATDYRIFSTLDLDYNYLFPVKLSPFNFEKELSAELERIGVDKISLFGWSMGAFLAKDFALYNAEKIDEVILLNIRTSYEKQSLEKIEAKVKENKGAYLYKFYLDCFSKEDKSGLSWFKKNLLKKYIEEIQLEYLISGLEYLSLARIEPESLRDIRNLRIFHGQDDAIAPLCEAEEFKRKIPQLKLCVILKRGHISFVTREFRDTFYNG